MGQTINLASKYSSKVAERFRQTSLTDGAFNKDYEFTGVKTVKVYSINTAPLSNYVRSGTARYGTPEDLGDTVQELIMSQDKSFTFIIDKGDASEQMNTKAAGRALRRQIDEVINPFVDQYRLHIWSQQAGYIEQLSAAPTKDTIVDMIMNGTVYLDNHLVPNDGRELRIRASSYKLLKTCPDFSPMDRVSEKAIVKGQVGEIDGMRVVKIPDSYMPEGVHFIITHKSACLSPMKLQDYKIHKDPPGISGDLAEGRLIFDAFVLNSRKDGIYVAALASSCTANPTVTPASSKVTPGTTKIVLSSTTDSAVICYTLDGTDPRFSDTAMTYTAADTGLETTDWDSTVTLRAYAKKDGLLPSQVIEETYTV